MTEPTSPSSDDQFASQLEACERLLDMDPVADSTIVPESSVPADVQARLKGGLAAVRRLKRLWRKSTPEPRVHLTLDPSLHKEERQEGDPTSIGRFQIVHELGRGGCGVVFLAYDPSVQREVALKVPRAEALVAPELRERFQQEARAAGALDHPNIVPVYEAGAVGPICYIASAYCPGMTLADWLKRRREPVPCADAAQLVATLAEAVQHAHQRGVLHRDLKPSNVLLQNDECRSPNAERMPNDESPRTYRDQPGDSSALGIRHSFGIGHSSFGIPKITDFGLAKLMAADAAARTHTGAVLGTPSYMAPEQAGGKSKEAGVAADVYALGAILYELLTGRPPFQGDSPLETLQQVQTVEPVPPSRLRYTLPRDLQTICLKCLEKEPARRYPSAADLAEDLRRFLAGEPIRARPASWLERGQKWVKRRPMVALLLAGIIVIATAAFAAVTWQLRQTEIARQDEEAERKKVVAALADNLIKLANLEWLRGNLDNARARLDECPPEHRNDEWRYLHWACARTISVPVEPHGAARKIIWSQDGKWLASFLVAVAGGDVVTIHDAATAKEAFRLGPVRPGSPAKPMDKDKVIVQRTIQTSHHIEKLAFTSDSQTLVMISAVRRPLVQGSKLAQPALTGRFVSVWDLAGRQRLDEWNLQPSGAVNLSANAQRLAHGYKNQASIWDVTTRQELEPVSTAPRPFAFALTALSADGRLLAGASYKPNEIIVLDLATRQILHVIPNVIPLDSSIGQCGFAPTGDRLAWAGNQRQQAKAKAVIWDLRYNRSHGTLELNHEVGDLAFSPDGRLLALAGSDKNIGLWDVESAQQIMVFRGHSAAVTGVAFSPDGTRLASAAQDGTIKIWNLLPPS